MMVRSVSYKSEATYAQGLKTSETYYDIHLGKGDEIADRSFNFTADGKNVKTESIFEYGTANLANGVSGNSAAVTSNPEDMMVRSVSYKSEATYAQGLKTSETYYDIHLGKGDE